MVDGRTVPDTTPPPGPPGGPDAEAFETLRPRLFGIAYRMLGARAEAEDLVQDAWLRLERAWPVASLEGFLTTAVTRLCIDHLRAARVRREAYVGPWLPEPLLTDPDDPAREVERSEALSLALLRVVDRLEPVERAVFLLREVFAYPYDEVAQVVDRKVDACRQIALRARERVRSERPRREAGPEEHSRLLERFARAADAGEVDELAALLAEDVVLVSDGGGKALAARNELHGTVAVSRFMVGVRAKAPAGALWRSVHVNGLPAALMLAEGRVVTALALDVDDGRIRGVLIVRNPDKLVGLARLADLARPGGDGRDPRDEGGG